MKQKTEPKYSTGEPIRKGDIVMLGATHAVVDELILEDCDGWDSYWRDATGEGVMLAGPDFGSLFTGFDDEDLFFVSRVHS